MTHITRRDSLLGTGSLLASALLPTVANAQQALDLTRLDHHLQWIERENNRIAATRNPIARKQIEFANWIRNQTQTDLVFQILIGERLQDLNTNTYIATRDVMTNHLVQKLASLWPAQTISVGTLFGIRRGPNLQEAHFEFRLEGRIRVEAWLTVLQTQTGFQLVNFETPHLNLLASEQERFQSLWNEENGDWSRVMNRFVTT